MEDRSFLLGLPPFWTVSTVILLSALQQHDPNLHGPVRRAPFCHVSEARVIGHVYWEGLFARKQWFPVKSFLSTGMAYPGGVRAIIWRRPNRTRFLPEVQEQIDTLGVLVTDFIWDDEIVGTPFSGLRDCAGRGCPLFRRIRRSETIARSDWARLLLLYRYGGVWFDCDLIFLTPIQDIIRRFGEFVTEWGWESYTNNCFMHFDARGRAVSALVAEALRLGAPAGVWGLTGLRKRTLLPGISVIPNEVTEFCWKVEHCDLGFVFDAPASHNSHEIIRLLDCVVWHWHNQPRRKIARTSVFAELERLVDEKLHLHSLTMDW